MIVFSGETFTFKILSSSLVDFDHWNNPPMGLSLRDGGFDVFSFAPPVVLVDTVELSELGGLHLLEENRLPGMKIASNFSMAGEYPLLVDPLPALLPDSGDKLLSAFGWFPNDAIHDVFRTRGGFSNSLPVTTCLSRSRLCTDVRVLSLELALIGGASLAPPTSDEEPPEDVAEDKSCTSYSDSCELMLVSRLERLLFFTFSRLAFIRLAMASFARGSLDCGCV